METSNPSRAAVRLDRPKARPMVGQPVLTDLGQTTPQPPCAAVDAVWVPRAGDACQRSCGCSATSCGSHAREGCLRAARIINDLAAWVPRARGMLEVEIDGNLAREAVERMADTTDATVPYDEARARLGL